MIVAPDASFAVTVTGIVTALPAYGMVFAMLMLTESTTPSSVIGTLVGVVPILALTEPLASFAPPAFVPEYSVTANVSLPTGAVTFTVHDSEPFDVVQPPEDPVTFAVTEGAAPFTPIVSDCVFGETYFPERCADCRAAGGIEIVKRASELRGEPACGNVALPPPPQAANAKTDTATSARLSTIRAVF